MILTDREIGLAMKRGSIQIDPRPSEKMFSSTSLDLTLDPAISLFLPAKSGVRRVLDLSDEGFDQDEAIADMTKRLEIDSEGFQFNPGQFILAWTKEYVNLKADALIAARVEGKSSLARLGVGIHITAPVIHAGFDGQIRLEMLNHGVHPILLKAGMKICQLVFEQTLGTPERGYRGQYSGQDRSRAG